MNKLLSLLIRYLLIFFAGFGNLQLFYFIFYPLTFYLSSFVLSLFGDINNLYAFRTIIFNQTSIELVNACIAGSAYYLLFVLSMAIPNMKVIRRLLLISFVFLSLLLVNVLRIVIMGLIADTIYFESIHILFWYVISLVFVVGIWFLGVKIFRIKSVPIYSDLMDLIKQVKNSKRKSKHYYSSK